MMPGRARDQDGWMTDAQLMLAAREAAYRAAKDGDVAALEALGEADRRRALALAQRGRADRGHQDVLAARALPLLALDALDRDLGLGVAVQLDLVVRETQLVGDLGDGANGAPPQAGGMSCSLTSFPEGFRGRISAR